MSLLPCPHPKPLIFLPSPFSTFLILLFSSYGSLDLFLFLLHATFVSPPLPHNPEPSHMLFLPLEISVLRSLPSCCLLSTQASGYITSSLQHISLTSITFQSALLFILHSPCCDLKLYLSKFVSLHLNKTFPMAKSPSVLFTVNPRISSDPWCRESTQ